MSEIVPLSELKPTERCPQCHAPISARGGTQQNHLVSMNGAALWSIYERCSICPWFRTVENVKMGA